MYKLLICFVTSLFTGTSFSQPDSLARLYAVADSLIARKPELVRVHQAEITDLLARLRQAQLSNRAEQQFALELEIAKAYTFFRQDSALSFAHQARETAVALADSSRLNEARTRTAFLLLLRGYFKEAVDTLASIRPESLTPNQQITYYEVYIRAYSDLANLRRSLFGGHYRKLGDYYTEKLWAIAPPNSYAYLLGKALNHLAYQRYAQSEVAYRKILAIPRLSAHRRAVCHYGLGVIYGGQGMAEKQKYHLLRSVIYDLESNTKETAASRGLAEQLYKEGDITRAAIFIRNAKEDSEFYDSDLRRLDVANLAPKIEEAQRQILKHQKRMAHRIAIAVSVGAFAVLVLSLLLYRQMRRLSAARKTIELTNTRLTETNELLREANKIKVEYIGYYFNFSTRYIHKLDTLKRAVLQQLVSKQYNAIDTLLKRYDPHEERTQLFAQFDTIFLQIFPDFVAQFNLLFPAEHHIVPPDARSLTTDLRIFALIRLGITNNEQIAALLNFSVNTIYTYKTKIKKRSLIANDTFDAHVLAIRSV